MKKVLQSCLSTGWGGLEMVALESAERLQAAGVDVLTACLPDTPLDQRLRERGLKTVHLPSRHPLSWSGRRRFRALFRDGGFDAVLIQRLSDLWLLNSSLKRHPELKVLGVSHTFVGVSKKDLLHRIQYARLNALIALTGLHRDNLLANLPIEAERLHVIPNAVDTERFHPSRRSESLRRDLGAKDDEVLIGVVSRLDRGKGLFEALEAAKILAAKKLPFHLCFIGKDTVDDPGTGAEMEKRIAELGLRERVTMAGHRTDIEAVTASLDLFLMPAPGETFGRVLIEAMASGVPLVATGGGGVPDIVHDGVEGLLVKPFDAPGMAAALERLIGDRDLRALTAAAALKAAREVYDAKVILKAWLALISGAPGGASGPR